MRAAGRVWTSRTSQRYVPQTAGQKVASLLSTTPAFRNLKRRRHARDWGMQRITSVLAVLMNSGRNQALRQQDSDRGALRHSVSEPRLLLLWQRNPSACPCVMLLARVCAVLPFILRVSDAVMLPCR